MRVSYVIRQCHPDIDKSIRYHVPSFALTLGCSQTPCPYAESNHPVCHLEYRYLQTKLDKSHQATVLHTYAGFSDRFRNGNE